MSQSSEESHPQMDILTYQQRCTFSIVNYVVICTIICFLGIIANLINIVVFLKQGFQNTVNISFFGLAISDLCCLLTLQWVCFCFNPYFANTGLPWVFEEFQYLTAAWPHVISGRITSYITVYITGERCLCMLAPLKVKQIITPLRTTIAVTMIYILNIITVIPEYMTSYLDWKFFPETNRTLLALAFTSSRDEVAGIVYFLGFVTGVTSFLAVIIFTAILVVKLKQTSQWRQSATSGSSNVISSRDKKTVKLTVFIASSLIVCFTPSVLISMITFIEPEFHIGKRYSELVISMWSISCVFQAANSSSNIILYYHMSSNYRQTFNEIFNTNKMSKKVQLLMKTIPKVF